MEASGLLSPGGRTVEPAIRGLMAPRQPAVVSTKRRWYEQPTSIMIATIAALMVFGAVLESGDAPGLSSRSESMAPESLAVGTAWKGNGTYRTISMQEMLEQSSVQKWLSNLNIVWDDLDEVEKLKFLPSRLLLYIDLAGIERGGTGASTGYVAFNIANNMGSNASKYFSSYLVVLDYASGDIVNFIPTFDAQSYPGLGASNRNTTFCAIKFKDPDTMILGGNVQQTEFGGSFTMRWQEKDLDFVMLPGGRAPESGVRGRASGALPFSSGDHDRDDDPSRDRPAALPLPEPSASPSGACASPS